ncbi:MAG: plasmid pRiA4b ORF-3 family protein [Muribaculaceae bacterium]|nr:plasmid pRiA4b ORF-3 family protein [Muribaculaceae bacterium]
MAKKKRFTLATTPDIEEHSLRMAFMMTAIDMGITPEEYAEFYENADDFKAMLKSAAPQHTAFQEMDGDDTFGPSLFLPKQPIIVEKSKLPRKDAAEKSLVLKVQLCDVSTPPMWRELIVPADFNFTQLHYAIQAAMGLLNLHLWMFQKSPYNKGLAIGIPQGESGFSFGLDDATHDADETPLTAFLADKGDKLFYVYDFGDDWIFKVTVTKVIDRQSDRATLGKYKCDFQVPENIGGVGAYREWRKFFEQRNTLTKKQKEQFAKKWGFYDINLLDDRVETLTFNPDEINAELKDIPSKWEDFG